MELNLPKPPPDCGQRLMPILIDSIAKTEPKRPFISVPKSLDLSDGYKDINYDTFANAVNRCAWTIERILGRSPDGKTVLYIGPLDIRYLIVLFGLVKTGYRPFFSSSRNSLKAHLSLLDTTQCYTILLPDGAPAITKQILAKRPMQIMSTPELEYFLDEEKVTPYPYNKDFDEVKDETLVILHTSGSTGIPKPVYVKHGTLASHDAYQMIPSLGGKPTFPDLLRGRRFLVAFPLFHAANLGCTLAYNIFFGVTCVIPPPIPPTAEVVDMIHTHGNVFGSVLPPSTLIDIFNNPTYFENMVKRLKLISYNGGSLATNVGDSIARRMRLITMFGSTETQLVPIELTEDRKDWQYLSISPFFGHKYRHHSDDLYEHVNIRDKKFEPFQGVFHTFPDLQEYPMSDLYRKHPTKSGYWLYQGRTDDIITFSNAEKLNPVTMEGTISSHPAVNSAIIAGSGRFQASLLIEPKISPKTAEERKQLLDEIWPVVEQANQDCPTHGRILKKFIIFTTPNKPMPRAGKGTVQRSGCLKLYADEFEALYTKSSSPGSYTAGASQIRSDPSKGF